jgi:hypothetical protein
MITQKTSEGERLFILGILIFLTQSRCLKYFKTVNLNWHRFFYNRIEGHLIY